MRFVFENVDCIFLRISYSAFLLRQPEASGEALATIATYCPR